VRVEIQPVSEPARQGGVPERRLALRVVDEGVGIPDGELESIFEKFVQSSKTRSGAGGTGLGLPICREIVQAHGGEIFAGHARGGGAVLAVMLPLAERAVAPDRPVETEIV
jgi:signal transduction histidine kinase